MNQKDELQLLRNALNMLGVAAVALTSCLVWAYLMGRCFEWVYLVPFNATWLINQFSTTALVGVGWPVIPVCLFGAVLVSREVRQEPIKGFELRHFLWSTLATIVLCAVVIVVFFYELSHAGSPDRQKHIFWIFTLTNSVFLMATCLVFFLALKKHLFGWNVASAAALLLAFFVFIVYMPANVALGQSFQDFFPATSGLPQVTLKTPPPQAADLRLLLHANGFLYAVDLLSSRHDVRILTASDVAIVSAPPLNLATSK
jgi:hypothetical protein